MDYALQKKNPKLLKIAAVNFTLKLRKNANCRN